MGATGEDVRRVQERIWVHRAHADTTGPLSWLIGGRPPPRDTGEPKRYFACSLDDRPPYAQLRLAHLRGEIERFRQGGKHGFGPADYQGQTWPGLRCHLTLFAVIWCYALLHAAGHTTTGLPPAAVCPPRATHSWPPCSSPSPARPASPASTCPFGPGRLGHKLAHPLRRCQSSVSPGVRNTLASRSGRDRTGPARRNGPDKPGPRPRRPGKSVEAALRRLPAKVR
jgi:hypothetical protein